MTTQTTDTDTQQEWQRFYRDDHWPCTIDTTRGYQPMTTDTDTQDVETECVTMTVSSAVSTSFENGDGTDDDPPLQTVTFTVDVSDFIEPVMTAEVQEEMYEVIHKAAREYLEGQVGRLDRVTDQFTDADDIRTLAVEGTDDRPDVTFKVRQENIGLLGTHDYVITRIVDNDSGSVKFQFDRIGEPVPLVIPGKTLTWYESSRSSTLSRDAT